MDREIAIPIVAYLLANHQGRLTPQEHKAVKVALQCLRQYALPIEAVQK